MINEELLKIMACPLCKTRISHDKAYGYFICNRCKLMFPILDGIPILLRDKAEPFEKV